MLRAPSSLLTRLTVLALAGGALLCQAAPTPAAAAPQPSNLARTRAELQRLKAAVRLPASSERRAPVHRLRSPGSMPEAGKSLKDHAQYYRVRLSLSKVVRWAHAHPPRGKLRFTFEGTSGPIGGPPSEVTVGYTARDTDAYVQPTLEYTIVPGRDGFTLWRVDEMALWLDPRPRVDRPGASPLRVTGKTGCPTSDRGSYDVRNPGSGLDRHLVPAALPDRVLVCTYAGLNGKAPFSLTGAHSAGRRRARALATAAHQISLAHIDGGVTSCPSDTGEATVVDFSYTGRPDVDLWHRSAGCQSIRNGHTIGGDVNDKRPFLAKLKRLS